ncbi:MAG TPA: hypothetical protein VMH28_14725 [Candidatus Acidoferrales bacterium]|nr:hypothetical protein [Candidatus Acidoferrales bacterium]
MLPLFIALGAAAAADFPQAEIASGDLRARLYLPDLATGYYRATRFDWAGVIPTLQYKGIEFFGQWFPRYDPKLNDSIVGPVESFDPIGYDQAKPGGTFLRIGVGLLRRPDEKPFNNSVNFVTHEIVDGGKWTSRPSKDQVEFTHDLSGVYLYRKIVRLEGNKLILDHALKNTGKELLETDVYNHDFYMIANLPSGPDITVRFPFEPRPNQDLKGAVEVRGRQLAYTRELQGRESVYTELEGFGPAAKDYDIHIENRQARAGVHQTSDHGMSKLHFWTIRSTVCPEAYTHIRVEPGQEFRWRVAFEFYTL